MKTLGILIVVAVIALAAFLVASGDLGDRSARRRDAHPTIRVPGNGGEPAGEARREQAALAPPTSPGPSAGLQPVRTSERPRHATGSAAGTPRANGSSNARPGARLNITGVVLDGNRPLRGAQVLIDVDGSTAGDANTDSAGRFEIPVPFPAADVVLRVIARGFATVVRDLGDQRTQTMLHVGNIFLQRGSVLAGIVDRKDGTPVLIFRHYSVDGKVLHEDRLEAE